MKIIVTANRVFTGLDWLPDHAVITEKGKIVDVLPTVSLPPDSLISDHSFAIVPSFIDIQIYGAAGKLFSLHPSVETLHLMNKHCISGGTHYFLPTVATNSPEVIKKSIKAIKEYWAMSGKGVAGLHLEGPWINKIKKGAHEERYISAPNALELNKLLDEGAGVIKMITLAPECCPASIIELIRSRGIVISAGHSNADFAEAIVSFDNGIRTVTHLFNAMSPLHHREPGIPGAVFQHAQVMASIIADGHHVHYELISIAKKLMCSRLFLITDAVTETNEGLYRHHFEGDRYTHDGILSGSCLTMIKAVLNCIRFSGISEEEALRMASVYPAKVLDLDHKLGLIKKGYEAQLTFLDQNWEVIVPDFS